MSAPRFRAEDPAAMVATNSDGGVAKIRRSMPTSTFSSDVPGRSSASDRENDTRSNGRNDPLLGC